MDLRRLFVLATLSISGATALALAPGAQGTLGSQVIVVPSGQPVQVTFTAVTEEWAVPLSDAWENAARMAVEQHPTIRGFAVQMNHVDTLCDGDNTSVASSIVANTQNAGIVGHLCSSGFASALPVYEAAGVVTISGSATASALHGAPLSAVFNRTAVVSDAIGDAGDRWAEQVASLPSVQAWAEDYEDEFGTPPLAPGIAALYFDSMSLLLDRIERVSRVVNGKLVISRPALALAVRATSRYPGVSCTITLELKTGNRVNDQAALSRCAAG